MPTISDIFNLGLQHHTAGNLEQAEQLFRQILAQDPRHADALHLLGVVAHQKRRDDLAVEYIVKAITLNPAVAEYHNSLGIVLKEQGKIEEAIECYRRALALQPAFAVAYNNLGNVFKLQGKTRQAIESYRRALALQPTYAEAHQNLGLTLQEQDMLEEAAACYRSSLALRPNDGLRIKLATMLPSIPLSVQDVVTIRKQFEAGIDALLKGDLTLTDPVKEVVLTDFFLAYHGCDNRDLLVKMAKLYEHACPPLLYTAPHCASWRGGRKGDKIKIGFISRFFRNHSVGKAARGVLALLSRQRFSVTAFFVPPVVEDEIATFVRQRADQAVLLPDNLDAARARIAEEALDILFYQDIGMDPFTYFLAFARLAPVQCVFFGHAETSGIRNLDYYISSENIESDKAQDHYSERLVKLKSPCAYYYKPAVPAFLKPRSAFGLDDADHLYLCPQALFKFHPEFDAILSRILEADPRARVVLKEDVAQHRAALLLQRFRRTMGRLADRVTVLPPQPGEDFINLIAVVDVMLDPLHFSGLTTSLEAFAVGTPVVTLPEGFQRSRLTLSLYHEMGMHDCVADSPSGYVKIALRLGTDATYRQKIKASILKNNHRLYEDSRVVKEYERVFLDMVKDCGRNP